MIVGARMKGAAAQALATGWHAEAFARTKRLKPLDKLLEPALTPEEKRNAGTGKVLAMFRAMKLNQEKKSHVPG
ncbi:hypothetical protein EDF57_103533 [Novosphingobium sp. PhB55]|uniref:hypothetical protein n=1 Tax=Novosphingobium sp. PhB55 TaxID=2485106 RepID=UPI00106680E2|nr:hypothetical protein [Novosphingobium sp. PhB55]TDW65349.1 hypothetical protein EDF57_103533 [Novosphingobium sp. PhB55]